MARTKVTVQTRVSRGDRKARHCKAGNGPSSEARRAGVRSHTIQSAFGRAETGTRHCTAHLLEVSYLQTDGDQADDVLHPLTHARKCHLDFHAVSHIVCTVLCRPCNTRRQRAMRWRTCCS